MTACICGFTFFLISAISADLSTTAQFTAAGFPEMNPAARPFVQGRGPRGELVLGLVTAGTHLSFSRSRRSWVLPVQVAAAAIHATLAIRNVRGGVAREVPRIVFPVLIVQF